MTSIVIVGSGFTRFTCARRLARILFRRHAPADITIISPVDYMPLHAAAARRRVVEVGMTLPDPADSSAQQFRVVA